ncbi:FadR/GntR family transcriptional regulator [Gulosibacter sp. 10]|uniref:FadR/GntR family transcriptional regulator n=1 Tax=Gulosibacter sp. 10 TaxID=1255570 RepID=UPI00097E8130|nr:FCD domain-containing protein [Gulosibacter sp. 10]SJM50815.1 Lactate-responsive regulator LldR in Actinobacteria, GntR family [Gulosibacter sp. 10]
MKAHETVLQWVTGELAAGRLHVGDRLPGERVLSQELAISRSAVREALRVLEVLGTIRSATGSGPNAGTIITATPEQGLSTALGLQLASRQVSAEDLMQLRVLLETWCARSADPDGADWEEAERLLDRMDDPGLDRAAFLRLDAEFHAVCASAARNPLVSTLMDALRLTIAEQTRARAERIEGWAGLAERLQAEHRAVLRRLREGEGAEAATLLERHIRGYHERTERG